MVAHICNDFFQGTHRTMIQEDAKFFFFMSDNSPYQTKIHEESVIVKLWNFWGDWKHETLEPKSSGKILRPISRPSLKDTKKSNEINNRKCE